MYDSYLPQPVQPHEKTRSQRNEHFDYSEEEYRTVRERHLRYSLSYVDFTYTQIGVP